MRKPPFVAGRGKMIQVDENHYTGVGKVYAVGDVAGAPCIFFIYVSYKLYISYRHLRLYKL